MGGDGRVGNWEERREEKLWLRCKNNNNKKINEQNQEITISNKKMK